MALESSDFEALQVLLVVSMLVVVEQVYPFLGVAVRVSSRHDNEIFRQNVTNTWVVIPGTMITLYF